MGAKNQDIAGLILKESYDFEVKRFRRPEYVILDDDVYEELKAQSTIYTKNKEALEGIDQVCGMKIVRTFVEGRGISVGEAARP